MSTPLERRPSAEDLKPTDLEQLKEAHRRLREAVAAYEEGFSGIEVTPGIETTTHSASEIAKAQRRIEAAEADLWGLREQLLGWHRPPGAPSALETIDWFSEQDRVYDDIEVSNT